MKCFYSRHVKNCQRIFQNFRYRMVFTFCIKLSLVLNIMNCFMSIILKRYLFPLSVFKWFKIFLGKRYLNPIMFFQLLFMIFVELFRSLYNVEIAFIFIKFSLKNESELFQVYLFFFSTGMHNNDIKSSCFLIIHHIS